MRFALIVALLTALLAVPGPADAAGDPALSVPAADLAAALECPATFVHPEHEPVLLVHGTGTNGPEQYSWNYQLLLPARGYDACVVTYPDRGLGDMQVSAEYVVYAVHAIHARTGRKVDMVGHSQGGLMPRWAIKWWPSLQTELDDFVMLASPNHGVVEAENAEQSPFDIPAVGYQFSPTSKFITALNAGDESPGAVDYSSIYSVFKDELVQPDAPVPTAGLDWGRTSTNVVNLSVQDVCPNRFVDHLTIGTTDRLSQELVLDALSHPGPVDPSRIDTATCVLPDQYVVPEQFAALIAQMERSFQTGEFPDFHPVSTEPELAPYARGGAPSNPAPAPGSGAAPGPAPAVGGTLAATGGGPSLLLGLLAVAIAVLLRRLFVNPPRMTREIDQKST